MNSEGNLWNVVIGNELMNKRVDGSLQLSMSHLGLLDEHFS